MLPDRLPGSRARSNTLKLDIDVADDAVLSIFEGEMLGREHIEDLLTLVDQGPADETPRLTAERDRLRAEVQRLVESLARAYPQTRWRSKHNTLPYL